MSPQTGQLLYDFIVPRIMSAVGRGAVKPTGSEDVAELQQDGVAIAAAMLDSAEAAGKPLMPASVAYYALRALQSGRRSGYVGRMDAMCPSAALDGQVTLASLDAPMDGGEGDTEDLSLHDLLADPHADDPGTAAARRLDWDLVVPQLDARQQGVLMATAEGRGPGEIAASYEVTAPRICQIREELGEYIAAAWGTNGITESNTLPVWRQGMRALSERRAGRADRLAA